jgi:hypothetical protein
MREPCTLPPRDAQVMEEALAVAEASFREPNLEARQLQRQTSLRLKLFDRLARNRF